jgi:hypothetical protein
MLEFAGRLPTTFGKEKPKKKFTGGTTSLRREKFEANRKLLSGALRSRGSAEICRDIRYERASIALRMSRCVGEYMVSAIYVCMRI